MGYSLKSAGSENMTLGMSDDVPDVSYTADDLTAMTVARIKTLAAELGYSITKTLKADIIAEFLMQQDGEA